ncbi:MAG: hypothetical protein ACRCTY_02270, partial [Candidatus Adiutrix sp.]
FAKTAPPKTLVHYHLNMALKLADNYLKQGKKEIEAELELRAALGLINKKFVDTYPPTPAVYLSLARILKDAGRLRDSTEFYSKAQKVATNLLKKHPEEGEMLGAIIYAAKNETARSLANKEPQLGLSLRAEAQAPIVSPELLRDELRALILLGRLPEFQPRIESVINEAVTLFGHNSPGYGRYYSLKLKWLEESGLIDDLTAELLVLANTPLGRNEDEQHLNRANALSYAARINENSGRITAAIDFYTQALEYLNAAQGAPPERRKAVEEALERLGAQVTQGAP